MGSVKAVRTNATRSAATRSAPDLDPAADPLARESLEHLVRRYGSPLLIVDLDRIRAQYQSLHRALPRVDLHYALKPLPHAAVIEALASEGACFDLATNGEVNLVEKAGVPPERCIHTHPIKRDSDIRTALDYGVTLFVVDNPDELRKFTVHRSRAAVLIRLAFSSPDAVCNLSRKFGCSPESVPELLALAADLGVRVQGFSFHVGSQAMDPAMHVRAIEVCAAAMRRAAAQGHELSVLDIGGGFPVDYGAGAPPIEEYCAPIRAALARLPESVRVIAEPGRFIAAPAAAAVATVMGRALRDGEWWYYLDDGVYGCYSGQIYDHARYPLEALGAPGETTHPSVLAGPTCDSIDVISDRIRLPLLEVGDLIVGRAMGAYTAASASDFNFFPRALVLAIDRGRVATGRRQR